MREILFRGRDIAGNWHYGVPLIFTEDYVCMTAPHTYNKLVQPETVGQYTGLTDKNGKKIFEGDIVKHYHDKQFPESYSKGVIYWDEEYLRWKRTTNQSVNCCLGNDCVYEVIGNIHENPEQLGGEK